MAYLLEEPNLIITLPQKNHHLMISGILEEMFNGIGIEYLYFKEDSNYALGFEVFDVTKRDYKMRFGLWIIKYNWFRKFFIIEIIILFLLMQRYLTVNT